MPTETIVPVKIEETKIAKYLWPFTIGADPEFTVISGTRPMNAEDIFRTFFKGLKEKKGEDGRAAGFVLPGGDIGWDGHTATGELRPDPGTPEEVISNLKQLFAEAHKRMPFVDLTTLTVAAATGGHIHLSVPEELNSALENKSPKWAAIERTIGMFIILIMMGENNLSRTLRTKVNGGNYGDLLDFRNLRHFTHPSGANGYTIEIRGPSAEWVTSEKIALGTLAYMAIAWDSILKGNLKPLAPILFENKGQARETAGPLMDNYGNIQKLYLDRMRPFIRSHESYPLYKNALELVLNPTRVIEEKKKMHYCINEGWGFTSTSKSIPTNQFMNEDLVEAATSKFPEQILRNLSQFAWNEDLHVEQFATALSKRCVALGWKPKHEYFLFGMKKGMDALVMRDEEGQFITGEEIIKNKEDYKVVDNKFNRLGKKAEPVYGRVIHPKTGELTKEKDSKRVMIGIPYRMRQNNDVKPLMRLVLKFEKNPKAYGTIDQKSLPDGESKLKKEMEKDEELEKGFNEASRRGEQPQQLPREIVEAIQEQEREANPENPQSIGSDTVELILTKLGELDGMWRNRWSLTIEGATDCLNNIIGRQDNWPAVMDNDTRGIVSSQLRDMLMEIEEGIDDDIVLENRPTAQSYLLCAALGQQQGASLEKRSNQLSHQIRYRREDNSGFRPGTIGRQGFFELKTDGRTGRSARSSTAGQILDLIGISSPGARGTIETLMRDTNGWISVILNVDRAGQEMAFGGTQVVVNPNNNLPHVWNA